MTKILFILAGGAIGSLGRYAVSVLANTYFKVAFPFGTLAVNLIGSLLIGLLWGALETTNISSNLRTFIFIGVLGGFTTFSSYTLETLNLFRDGEIKYGIINVFANNFLGLLLVFGGFVLAKGIVNLAK